MLVLGLIQIILCFIILIYEYNKRSISLFFWAVILVIFCFPHFLESIFNISNYSSSVINKASLFVILFEILYFITRFILTSKDSQYSIPIDSEIITEVNKNEITNKKLFNRIFRLNIFVLIIFVLLFYIKYGRFFNITWGEFYVSSITANTLSQRIIEGIKSINHILFFAVSGLLVVSYYKKQKYSTIIIAFLIMYYSLATKNRIAMLPFFVSILIVVISKNNRLSIKQITKFTIIGGLSIYLVYAVWIFRHAGTINNFLRIYSFKSFNVELLNSILNSEGELSLRNIFYYFISINNKFPGLGKGATYIRLILMYIPTKFCFGIKPPDFAITMSSAYMNNINNIYYSVHPTFFGDLFANFNFIGIFGGIVWALLFNLLDKYIMKQTFIIKMCLLVLWGSCLIIVGRGSVYNGCFIAISASLILYFLYKIWFVIRKR